MFSAARLRYRLHGHHRYRISGIRLLSRNQLPHRLRHGLLLLLHIWLRSESLLRERNQRYRLRMYVLHQYRSEPSLLLRSNICHACSGSCSEYLHTVLPASPSWCRNVPLLHHNPCILLWSVCKQVQPELLSSRRYHRWLRTVSILPGSHVHRRTEFLYRSE